MVELGFQLIFKRKIMILLDKLRLVGNTLAVNVSDTMNLTLHAKNVGTATMSAGTFVFEASLDSTDGTDGTWFAVQAIRTNSTTVESTIALTGLAVNAGTLYAWEISVNGINWFRVRCTVATTANSIAQWMVQRSDYATEPNPVVQISGTLPVSGSVTTSGTTTNTPVTGTTHNLITAATTNIAVIKATAGNLYETVVSNVTATPVYVKLYNKATAPVLTTDVPVVTIPVPANSINSLNFGAIGKRFAAGIGISVTGAIGATDSTNAVAGVQINSTYL